MDDSAQHIHDINCPPDPYTTDHSFTEPTIRQLYSVVCPDEDYFIQAYSHCRCGIELGANALTEDAALIGLKMSEKQHINDRRITALEDRMFKDHILDGGK